MEHSLSNKFGYHTPDDSKKQRHEYVRDQCGKLANKLLACCPEGIELSLAITKLEEVMFWANAAIAREVVEE